jgi:hypothetical protein
MKTCIFALVASASIYSAYAAEEVEELYAKPGSMRGYIAIVNSQDMVPESVFVDAIDVIRERLRYDFKFCKDGSAPKGAAIQLQIVDDSGDVAPMTVSPEIGRGVLNVAALTNDLCAADTARKLPNRVKLEFLRMLCYAFSVGGSQFGGNLMSATSVQELDNLQPFIPVDVFDKIDASAKKRGLRPEILANYYEACEQGWAPAPTNDMQKAIWDKVHAVPATPMKIEFDPKKGR